MIVLIDIKKDIHREYLNSLFAFENDAYSVFRHNVFGKAICATVRRSPLPVKHNISEKTVRLRLPKTKSIRTAENHFLYFSVEDQLQLNDTLEVCFSLDFESYYQAGIRLGLMQKEVIQNFIISRKLVSMVGDIERLKKRQYRKEQSTIDKLTKQLLQKIHYRDRIIKSTIEKAHMLNISAL